MDKNDIHACFFTPDLITEEMDFDREKHIKKLELGKRLIDQLGPDSFDDREKLQKFLRNTLLPDELFEITAEGARKLALERILADIKGEISSNVTDMRCVYTVNEIYQK